MDPLQLLQSLVDRGQTKDQPKPTTPVSKEDNSLETDALTIKPSNNPDNISQDARRAFQDLADEMEQKLKSFSSRTPAARPINRKDIKDDNEGVSEERKANVRSQRPRFQRPSISAPKVQDPTKPPETSRSSRIGLPPRRNTLFARPKPPTRTVVTEAPGKLIIQEVTVKSSDRPHNNRELTNDESRPQELSDEENARAKVARNKLLKNMRGNGKRPFPSVPVESNPNQGKLLDVSKLDQADGNKDAKTVVSVTSSVSSSGRSSRPSGQRRKKKKVIRTQNPSLRDLTPAQRSLQKVKETLNKPPVVASTSQGASEASNPAPRSHSEDKHSRRKIVLRKKKGSTAREGRQLQEDSTFKHFKVRVRRPHAPPPFPIRH